MCFFRSSVILSDGVFRIIEVAAAAAAAATPFKDSSEWRSMKRVRLGRRARVDTGVSLSTYRVVHQNVPRF